MGLEFVFKKTTDLSIKKIKEIRELFLRTFEKEMSAALFERLFLYSCKGYSYHGLMLHNEYIVGSFSAVPYRYMYFGKELTFGLSVGTMIAKEHRGGANNLRTMAKLVYDAMIDDNIPFIFGFPNELYYSHEKRIHNTRDIGKLYYYVLPVNIGSIFPKMKFFNPLTRVFVKTFVGIPRFKRKTQYRYNVEKIADEVFEKQRYDNSYSTIQLDGGGKCIYKIYEEEQNIRTLYIIDVLPLTVGLFNEAVKKVYQLTSDHIDIIIYVGRLFFRPNQLIKTPNSKEPQKIRMTGKILIPEIVDDSIFTIENWNVNTSNFDVR